jgi:hypothetical protein
MVSHNQQNSPPTHELVWHLDKPYLTLNKVPHFRDETYGDVKTLGYNVGGCIVQGLNVRRYNVQGRSVSVPTDLF